ncbi:SMI1/KNR4 family protein [Gordonia sp. NB41Y]|uniref:SMI1/KNR4 family protein n=1 Tax=Gordonia sp. NB41Y TaxID=875808 RepID=UPI00128F1E82|nr:SMI1/KNR4 family protein [Gordonia sp. NB41Y]WLP90719.1 SMI1/KNR4 family protein [Gordonia sp. NB41Y]
MSGLQTLVEAITAAATTLYARDVAAHPENPDLWTPNPTLFSPATEEQISTVEQHLGKYLDPLHRELLAITDGWHHYNGWQSFLGSDDYLTRPQFVRSGSSWDELRDANWAFWDAADAPVRHPLPADRTTLIPIALPEEGYGAVSSIVAGGPRTAPGPVFTSGAGLAESFDSLNDYLTAELDSLNQQLDR